mmetsp:Transcript_7886/g.11383  ORF Transcript_7886/g.11383 Transcript_7886/m.11383 type:complete len:432 (+) Transcript_7886:72-1367(+)
MTTSSSSSPTVPSIISSSDETNTAAIVNTTEEGNKKTMVIMSTNSNTQEQEQLSNTTTTTTPHHHHRRCCRYTKIVYFVRHAEAEHNVREREAIAEAIANGQTYNKTAQEIARKQVLQRSHSLVDAPLSKEGKKQAKDTGKRVTLLLNHSNVPNTTSTSTNSNMRYQPPQVVFVSPLRRTLQTATLCFGNATMTGSRGSMDEDDDNSNKNNSNCWDSSDRSSTTSRFSFTNYLSDELEQQLPDFVAIEAMREKRTGMACDERRSVLQLQDEFPHVDFTDLKRDDLMEIPMGETNEQVQKRAADFFDNYLPYVESDFLAIVGHKGWLRELRHLLKTRADENSSKLEVKFDIHDWHLTLFGNAELRVAKLEWDCDEYGQLHLCSIHSQSLDHAIQLETGQIIHNDGSSDESEKEDGDEEYYDNELNFLSVRTV